MDYLAVKDLKKTRNLWEKLASERKLVITTRTSRVLPSSTLEASCLGGYNIQAQR